MNCEYNQEKLNAFFDGERTDTSISDSFTHLYGCESCQMFWREILDLRETAVNDQAEYPHDVDRAIYGLRRRQKNSDPFEVHLRLPRLAGAAFAAILLLLAFGAGYIISERSSERAEFMRNAGLGLPARVMYVYAIPGTTAYANEEAPREPMELKSVEHRNATYQSNPSTK